MKNGYFGERLGEYVIDRLPQAGLYEYIYKNDEILLKVDQYGVQTCQIDPPSGVALLKRERRENTSPAKVYFSVGEKVYDNFNVFQADKFTIRFQPQKAVYTLTFGEICVQTELFVPVKGRRFFMTVSLKNLGEKPISCKVMPCVYPYVNELMMAHHFKPNLIH